MVDVPCTAKQSKRGLYRRKRLKAGCKQGPRKCWYCGEPKKVHFWKSPSQPVCIICYQKRINVEACSLCSKVRSVRKRDEDGGAICHTCYQRIRPAEICSCCHEPGKIAQRYKNGWRVCNRCYQKKRREAKKHAGLS